MESKENTVATSPPNGIAELQIVQSNSLLYHTIQRLQVYLFHLKSWNLWKPVLLGQCVSLLNCATGIISQYLSSVYQVEAPTAQSFMNYVLLAVIYATWLACLPGDHGIAGILYSRGWKYILLAAIDVEANYMVVKAYTYTTLTSVQLLDCFTIPTVMVLSWIILKVRYRIIHIVGVGICLLGIGCVIWSDAKEDSESNGEGTNQLLGDLLCLGGATLYGISNVGQEFTVKVYNGIEYLGMIGLFGSFINGIQLIILEKDTLANINWNMWQIDVLMVSFSITLFIFYSIVPRIMRLTSATAFNLSILSCDFYSLVFGVFIFNFKFQLLYLLSFGLVIIGIVVYSIQPPPSAHQTANNRDALVDNPTKVDVSVIPHSTSYNSIPDVLHAIPHQNDIYQTSSFCAHIQDTRDQH